MKAIRILCYFFLFMSVISILLNLLQYGNIDPSVFGLIIFSLLYLFGFPILMNYSVKKNYESQKALREEQSWLIDNEEIRISAESYITSNKWSSLYKVTETLD